MSRRRDTEFEVVSCLKIVVRSEKAFFFHYGSHQCTCCSFWDALRSKSEPVKVPINVLQHPRGTKSVAHACSQWIDCTWVTLIAVRKRISIFGFSPLCLVDRFSQTRHLRVSLALIKVIQEDVLRALGMLIGSSWPSLARILTKTMWFFAKMPKINNFLVNMHLRGRWKSLLALLAIWKFHTV